MVFPFFGIFRRLFSAKSAPRANSRPNSRPRLTDEEFEVLNAQFDAESWNAPDVAEPGAEVDTHHPDDKLAHT